MTLIKKLKRMQKRSKRQDVLDRLLEAGFSNKCKGIGAERYAQQKNAPDKKVAEPFFADDSRRWAAKNITRRTYGYF